MNRLFPVTEHPGARRLAAAWLALAGGALGASALFALLLLASRTPWIGQALPGHSFFYPALVLHVNLSALIWFLAFGGALWSAALPARALGPGWIAFWLGAAGTAAIVVSPFAGGAALVNNYIPVLDNAVFLSGLGLFGTGALLGALRAIGLARWGETQGWLRAGLGMAALAVLTAVFSLGGSAWALPDFLPRAAHYEALFWGPGHTLQFAHTLLMMACWLALAAALGIAAPRGRAAMGLFFAAALPLLAVPAIHVLHPPAGGEFRHAFTALMSWGSWPVAAPLGLWLAWRALRAPGSEGGARALKAALLLSVTLFGFGLVVGSLIRHDNAMVPAHYHGVIGAVTLAFMALALRLLPALGLEAPSARALGWQAGMYGGGTLAMAAGLAWSGGHGVARKTAGAQQLLDGAPELAGMALMGAGGLVAIAGGLLFVLLLFRSLTRSAVAAGGRRTDRRPFALALALGLILVTGSFVILLPDSGAGRSVMVESPPPDPRRDPAGHSLEKRRAEIKLRFDQAVVMLHARQYEHAATALHRVLELDPQLPEAHVNMGYAMIGLGRHKVARDFFEGAIELRPMQANAYYGLAEALEGMGEIEGAIGAMRTYMHLAPPDDPFQRKAEAALWEWESRRPAPAARAPGKPARGSGKDAKTPPG